MGHNLCLHVGADEHPCAAYVDVHQGYRVLSHSQVPKMGTVTTPLLSFLEGFLAVSWVLTHSTSFLNPLRAVSPMALDD